MGSLFFGASITKLLKIKHVSVDCAVFKLHYKLTAVVLFAGSVLVSSYQFFGNPIECLTQRGIVDAKAKRFIETFCWIEGTYSLPKAYDQEVGVDVVYAGVDNSKRGDVIVEHSYYQWVSMFLFLQCLMFFLPHFIWKSWEGGKVRHLLMELDKPIEHKETRDLKFDTLADYFFARGTGHRLYFTKYVICECLNFVNVIGQMYLIDTFLHGEFTTYGPTVVNFMNLEQEYRTDPMIKIFPRMTKCSFYNYGPSGDVQAHDVFCILPLNIINEKVYVFIWFWFVILSVLTAVSLSIKFILMVWPHGRSLAIKYACLVIDEDKLQTVMKKSSAGDWWILYLLAKSMDKMNFRDFVGAMALRARGTDM